MLAPEILQASAAEVIPINRKLRSRDEIPITTSVPNRLPLPNKSILDMQWILQQMGALKGDGEATMIKAGRRRWQRPQDTSPNGKHSTVFDNYRLLVFSSPPQNSM
jgi:hypothetical protein